MRKVFICIRRTFHLFAIRTGGYAETLKHAAAVQREVVAALSLVLTVFVFGVLVPPLMMIAPLSVWLQLCALEFSEKTKSEEFFGQLLATNVLSLCCSALSLCLCVLSLFIALALPTQCSSSDYFT